MIRIGVDPGVRECGVAIESVRTDRNMRYAFLVRSKRPTLTGRALDMAEQIHGSVPALTQHRLALCIEGQQVYRSEKAKGDPNDMVKLATVAGILAGYGCRTYRGTVDIAMPLPRTWKGNTPKAIHHERLARDFPHWVEPVAADTPKSLQHHVWDAVGLLEWHKERTT